MKYKIIEREIIENSDWLLIELLLGGMVNGYTRLVSISLNYDGSFYCFFDFELDVKSFVFVLFSKILLFN